MRECARRERMRSETCVSFSWRRIRRERVERAFKPTPWPLPFGSKAGRQRDLQRREERSMDVNPTGPMRRCGRFAHS